MHLIPDDRPLLLSKHHFYRPLTLRTFPIAYLTPPIHPSFLRSFLAGALSPQHCRRIGFREQTSRRELIERTVSEVAGTVLTAQLALKYGLASHLAGGTHHATSEEGRGYTILNDLAVVARLMTWRDNNEEDGIDIDGSRDEENAILKELYRGQNDGRSPVERVLVVDCDVHQGDGTASFHVDPEVGPAASSSFHRKNHLHGKLFTLDLHAASNYPSAKAKCTYDCPLPDHCSDDLYLSTLTRALDLALDQVRPQLVLYNAGVDVHRSDKLGRLDLSDEGLKRRDHCVLSRCIERGIPVAAVVGGGYDDDVRALGRRHALVHRVCARIWREKELWKRGR